MLDVDAIETLLEQLKPVREYLDERRPRKSKAGPWYDNDRVAERWFRIDRGLDAAMRRLNDELLQLPPAQPRSLLSTQ